MEDMTLKSCPFCGEDKAMLVYINEEGKTVCVDSDEELNAPDILAFIHCYGCDMDYMPCTDRPKEVIEAWNCREQPEFVANTRAERRDFMFVPYCCETCVYGEYLPQYCVWDCSINCSSDEECEENYIDDSTI